MNGIERITEHIEADTRAEVARIEAEAEARCAEIQAAYEAKAAEEYQAIRRAGEKSADQQLESLGNVAALEAKKRVLSAKQEQVTAAFELAKQQLTELPEERMTGLLARLAADAAETGREELRFNPRDRERLGEAVCTRANALLRERGQEGALTLSDRTADICGGVIVSGGRIEMNCSFETLLGETRSAMATEVARLLFGQ